ncbi:hypothetical protein Ancab_031577 [Ancistrocladus abbreviatus]
MEGIMGEDTSKIRKRGCSPSSSTSSIIQNYRFKRAILVGKRGGGSATPMPTWRMVSSRSRSPTISLRLASEFSPKYPPSQSGKSRAATQQPVSARKLAATLWELNEVPSPSIRDDLKEKKVRNEERKREKMERSVRSGSFPAHLSDPSHSPVSERMDRSATGSRRIRESSRRPKVADHNGVLDSISNVSMMEIETRSRCQTPAGSTIGVKPRLKDISNALTTSKELLKIIIRVWSQEDQPSSSTSLISALHTELERARLQVNELIHEQRSDQNEVSYLLKCFAEEKAAWKNKEREMVESAVESIAGELEVERKLRRQFESLNKKLGRELAEMKALFLKVVKELQGQKRARGIVEQVCSQLARDIGEDKTEAEEMKREHVRLREEFEKEREMLHVAEALREEGAQTKLVEAKHNLEEKNTTVDELKKKLKPFLRSQRGKEKGQDFLDRRADGDLLTTNFGFSHIEGKEEDNGQVEDGVDSGEDSAESDLHSIELNTDNYKINSKSNCAFLGLRDSRKLSADEELKSKSAFSRAPRRSATLLRSASNLVEWGGLPEGAQGSNFEVIPEAQRRSCGDEALRYKSIKGLREHILSGSRLGPERGSFNPSLQRAQPWPSRDPGSGLLERPMTAEGSGTRLRLEDGVAEGQYGRRSRR